MTALRFLDQSGGNNSLEAAMATCRHRMVEEQLVSRGIRDERVLEAMGRIERHRFVPVPERNKAYSDHPVPIAAGQTLSQPYIVAVMTEVLELSGDERVLEIGTGSGYQTAVLAELAREVYTVEVGSGLAEQARELLAALGYRNIHFRVSDGRGGWPEATLFDAILVTAAPEQIPTKLRSQLAEEGSMVIPVGPPHHQELELHQRRSGADGGFALRRLGAVRFVSLV